MKRSVGLSVFIGLVLVLVATPAGADRRTVTDPNDTPGVLGVARIGHSHAEVRDRPALKHKVITQSQMTKSDLEGPQSFINFFFDTSGGERADRRVTVDVTRGKLRATMYDQRSGDQIRLVDLARPTHKRTVVRFPVSLLGEDLTSYRWYVVTVFHTEGDGPCGTPSDVVATCVDRAPDEGSRRHQL